MSHAPHPRILARIVALLSLVAMLVATLGLGGALAGALAGCERDATPPLVEVTEVFPREVEVGDRVELRGAGFPQGRLARVTFRGMLSRPGQSPIHGATIEADGVVSSSDRIEIVVGEAFEERFCGHGDHAVHTTMTGDVEVAFASSAPGAPPLVGIMHGLVLDVTPSSVRSAVVEQRKAEGVRVLGFLGVTPGTATPRGLPIEKVEPSSPADLAGFQTGDLISAVDGVHVRELADVAPASARAAQITLRHGDSGTEETKSVPMIGYAGDRIPSEYGPALLLVGLALAFLVLLVLPAPVIASSLELRVARRLRTSGAKAAIAALFGRGPRAVGSALASVLVGTFALGPHVIGADLDAALLLLAAIALFLASRVAAARGSRASARAAAEIAIPGLVLAASLAGIVVHGGALRLVEIVRAQGGSPWEFAALRQPVACALAFAYLGGLLVMLRPRDEVALLGDARVEDSELPARTEGAARTAAARAAAARTAGTVPSGSRRENDGRLLERLGLIVACALAVAVFFGGWQLPGGTDARSTFLQIVGAVVFVAKTWGLAGALLGVAAIASPWSTHEARLFVLRRLVPALAVGAAFVAVSRKIAPSESLEAALGITVVTAFALLAFRTVLRIRGAMLRPEPHASPFL